MRRIILLNPYAAGSHAQWARGMVRECPLAAERAGVQAQFELFELPGRHWKWRMSASALALVERMGEAGALDRDVDRFIVTDMMDVGQFRSALPPRFRSVPITLYFHENQLTFPEHPEKPASEWDRHYAFMNVTGALLADQVWFNSDFHKREFLSALPGFMSAFPSPRPRNVAEGIASKSMVVPIGMNDDVIEYGKGQQHRPRIYGDGPPVVVWNHRWEYDKGPAAFLEALNEADAQALPFRLAMLGQQFAQVPPAFAEIQRRFSDRIVQWGHVESRAEYLRALGSCDIALVTAHHDFFGISVLESAMLGLDMVVPNELVYPEHFKTDDLVPRNDLTRTFCTSLQRFPRKRSSGVVHYSWSQVVDKVWRCLFDV